MHALLFFFPLLKSHLYNMLIKLHLSVWSVQLWAPKGWVLQLVSPSDSAVLRSLGFGSSL